MNSDLIEINNVIRQQKFRFNYSIVSNGTNYILVFNASTGSSTKDHIAQTPVLLTRYEVLQKWILTQINPINHE